MSESPVNPTSTQKSKNSSVAFAAFEDSNYRKLFAANSAIFFGIAGKILLISLLAVGFTETAYPISKINFSLSIPLCLGSIVAGAMVDRMERRRLMLLGLLVMTCAEGFVCFKLFLGTLLFWQLVLATIVSGLAFPFITPASTAMMYQLLGYHRVGSGMAMISGVMSMSRVVSPWITSKVIDVANFRGGYLFFVILFVSALGMIWRLPKSLPTAGKHIPLIKDIAQGFQYLKQTPQVLVCLVFGMLPLLIAMPAQFFMVYFANEVWEVGQEGLGYLIAAMGIGGILGAFLVAHLQSGAGRLKMMVASAILSAASFACFSQPSNFYVALVFLVAANGGAIACQTVSNVSLQLLVDDKIRGRVTSFTMMSFGLTPFVALPLELGIEKFGAPNTFLVASIVLLGVIGLFYVFSPSLRKLDDYIAESFHEQQSTES